MPCCKLPDLDDVLSYRTLRTVKIRDRRLGCLMVSIQVGIFTYVVLYSLIAAQGA